ncbi:hypothetical protein KM043_013565 [Ampulex compressa]|nr:hypothetical protein KM043_013565 [Ampulex compressa]
MERSARTARRARLRGIEGSRDRGIEGSRDRGIEGSRERPAKRRAAGRRRFLGSPSTDTLCRHSAPASAK